MTVEQTEVEAALSAIYAERAALVGDDPSILSSVPEPGRDQRRAPWLAVVAVAATVLIVAAVMSHSRDRGGQSAPQLDSLSPAQILDRVRSATESAAGSKSFDLDTTMAVEERTSTETVCSSSTKWSGSVDLEHGVSRFNTANGPIIENRDGSVTLSASALPGSWGVSNGGVQFSALQLFVARFALAQPALFQSAYSDYFLAQPGDIDDLFSRIRDDTTDVVIVGKETVDGSNADHFRVSIDLSDPKTNALIVDRAVAAGILAPDEGDRLKAPRTSPTNEPSDRQHQIDVWLDDSQQIVQIVATMATGTPGPHGTATTQTFTYHLSHYGGPGTSQLMIDPIRPAGTLPATILEPVAAHPCGQSPVPTLNDCGKQAFDKVAAGRTVDELIAQIPRTARALPDPNAWFGCEIRLTR